MLRLGDDVARHGRIPPATADRAIAAVRRLQPARRRARRPRGHRQGDERDPHRRERQRARRPHRGRDRRRGRGDQRQRGSAARLRGRPGERRARARARARASTSAAAASRSWSATPPGLRWATSLPLGVGRLTAECVHDDPPSKADRKRLDERIARRARAARRRGAQPRSRGMAVGTSGTLNDLVRMAVALRVGRAHDAREHRTRCARRAPTSSALHERIMAAKTSERRRMPGLEEQRRAELLARRFDAARAPRSSCSSSTVSR